MVLLKVEPPQHGCGSKPMGSYFGGFRCTILEPILVGIGMFTGILTHDQMVKRFSNTQKIANSAKDTSCDCLELVPFWGGFNGNRKENHRGS